MECSGRSDDVLAVLVPVSGLDLDLYADLAKIGQAYWLFATARRCRRFGSRVFTLGTLPMNALV